MCLVCHLNGTSVRGRKGWEGGRERERERERGREGGREGGRGGEREGGGEREVFLCERVKECPENVAGESPHLETGVGE